MSKTDAPKWEPLTEVEEAMLKFEAMHPDQKSSRGFMPPADVNVDVLRGIRKVALHGHPAQPSLISYLVPDAEPPT